MLLQDVFDKDTFYSDPMINTELDIGPLVDVVKMRLQSIPDNVVMKKLVPNRQNFLAKESVIYVSEGTMMQDVVLRLRNVEYGTSPDLRVYETSNSAVHSLSACKVLKSKLNRTIRYEA